MAAGVIEDFLMIVASDKTSYTSGSLHKLNRLSASNSVGQMFAGDSSSLIGFGWVGIANDLWNIAFPPTWGTGKGKYTVPGQQ